MRHIIAAALLLMPGLVAAAPSPRSCAAMSGTCITAHRGRTDPARAENSLRELRRTVVAGPYMSEIDLAASRSGKLYLLHDTTLDRTTSGHGALADLADARVAALRLRDGAGKLTDEPVPSFARVLRWARGDKRATLMLDIKQIAPAKVAADVRLHGLIDRVLLLTFDRATALAAFAADPDLLVSVLVNSDADLQAYKALAAGRQFAAYVPGSSPAALFAHARAAGTVVISDTIMPSPAGTIDDRAEREGASYYRQYLASRPIDILVTDHPDRVPSQGPR